jgi:hypothetical protein
MDLERMSVGLNEVPEGPLIPLLRSVDEVNLIWARWLYLRHQPV